MASTVAIALSDDAPDYDGVLDRIGDAAVVLIGEATHGTHDFYRTRAESTQRLIATRGFDAVCIEGDCAGTQRALARRRGARDVPERRLTKC